MKKINLLLIALVFTILTKAQERPNVVIMLADNVGWGDVGAYGGGVVRGIPTPRLDQLASEGMQMTQFLVEPGCTPSRAGLITGRYSVRSGLNSIIGGGTSNTLKTEEITIAELFKSKGYSTAMTGKWHLGSEEQSWPTRQGFDEYHVGVIETTDGTLYRDAMERSGLSQAEIEKIVPRIYESDTKGNLKAVREYTTDYRRQVEGDIANASVDYIKSHANKNEPFFLYVGWTQTHYPNLPSPEFAGKTGSPYGDCMAELDYRTGQVLDAIKEAGIEDNTIVIWLSDNAASPTLAAHLGYNGGNNGPFRGELGDPLEGSIRVPGMIKWPKHIKPGRSNEMISIHDFLPTLATIIGADLPMDRPIDGIDQSSFFLGKQSISNRKSQISFIENEIAGVRWGKYRFYPKAYIPNFGNPYQEGALGLKIEKVGFPDIFDIESDPREENSLTGTHAWVARYYFETMAIYNQSLKKYPNPKGVTLTGTDFGK